MLNCLAEHLRAWQIHHHISDSNYRLYFIVTHMSEQEELIIPSIITLMKMTRVMIMMIAPYRGVSRYDFQSTFQSVISFVPHDGPCSRQGQVCSCSGYR